MTPLLAVRAAAVTAIAAALPSVKVGPVRTYARGLADLPAAEVSTPRAVVRRLEAEGARELTVTLQVLLMAAGSAPEDTLSPMAETVEAAVLGSEALADLVDDWRDTSIDFDPGDGAETRPAMLRLMFDAVIYTESTA